MGEWKALKKASGTGWKELERETGTGWKALWEVNIDIGAPAITGINESTNYTVVGIFNPANANGTIDKLDVYIMTAGNVEVAIYEDLGSNSLKCKDYHDCGSLSTGLHSDIAVDLSVLTGEYIGFYCTSPAQIAYIVAAGYGKWYKEAKHMSVGTTYDFSWYEGVGYKSSCYGSNY